MKNGLYLKLALEGMRKNKKIYTPYILSCIGMVAMQYILNALSYSPYVLSIRHGSDITLILSLGKFVIAIFSLIFLFYTNSFLTKTRFKEFGLYSVLGMGKKGNRKIIIWDSIVVAGMGIIGGLFSGILLSKLAELGLLYMARENTNYEFTVPFKAVTFTVVIYLGIFFLIMLRSILKIGKANPIELLKSEHEGERPVKANWILAILGALILGVAYYLALSIVHPMDAIITFFIAVILVIIGTYLLFISGSVAICKLLQKNKGYYYNKKHFVSTSSMTYRMKRNGAGLASICILSTMVLVMISSTGSLYYGSDDAMKTRFPRDAELDVYMHTLDNLREEKYQEIDKIFESVFKEHNTEPKDLLKYGWAAVAGALDEDRLDFSVDTDVFSVDYNKLYTIFFIDQNTYNKLMGTELILGEKEAAIYPYRCSFEYDDLVIGDVEYKLVKRLEAYPDNSEASQQLFPSLMLVIKDYDQIKWLESALDEYDTELEIKYSYGYNTSTSEDECVDILFGQADRLCLEYVRDEYGLSYYAGCLFAERDGFYASFGSLFFLGIILSIIFTFAAAVIIYYKQISEGYEDQKRFEIMQNIGMTKEDIKKTISEQVLTVFYAPLVAAGIHLAFAFPFLWKMLQLFSLRNEGYVIMVTVIAYIAFAVFYALIYRITSKSYYSIVAKA